jgi:hypothetical protein
MNYVLHITKHAHKRYCQRVGSIRRMSLFIIVHNALYAGLYEQGLGVIQICGIWWACKIRGNELHLTTCYGRLQRNMIEERRGEGDGVKSQASTIR